MLKISRHRFLLVVAGCLVLAQPVLAAEETKGNLVSASWLQGNLKNADVLLLDASPAQIYKKMHIAGAVNVDAFALLSFGVREESQPEMEKMYQSLGISPGKKIVMYDQGGSWMAPRLFFSLQYYGYPAKDLVILDGGLYKWQKDGLPVTSDATPPPARGNFKIGKTDETIRARLPEFLTASGDLSKNVLLEALGPDWHYGEIHFFPKAGHVPNAVLSPSEDYFHADKTFKSPEEIAAMLTYLSVRPEQQIYAHCGGGGAASVPYFALRYLAHYPNVKMYSESEMGWIADERELPFWTYDAPYLMRETGWLQSWGGKMMRMYGNSQVSVVDVRPAEAFKQGHVPYAINIPADVFRSTIGDPDKLAQALGNAGVNASYEAVVISNSGLTRDSALAFVMLEKLGQKKVSVFMDSMDSPDAADKMAQLGFAMTKDITPAGSNKASQGVSATATVYPVRMRKDVLIADPSSSMGIYPKVYVASGKGMPAKAPEGKVVHVPYADLLNADGTPKAAKDIWSILVKAGVPRYGELVLFSDDPGEAAANYFVFKLMGYPDVKILVI